MNLPTKTNVLQTYQIILYNRALHPESMALKGRRVVKHGEYELEAWILPGTHMLRFDHRTLCVSELLTDQERTPPLQGQVSSFLCAGERDVEHRFPREKVTYMTSVQTETLSDSLYAASLEEMLDHARLNHSLSHTWDDEAGRCLSILDIQRMARQVHVQSYHLIASAALVLRTQTIFEHA
ncbi:MAG TPA: DUF2617 family protein [Phycisphaerales bacterium]|nr:DUF2617 family protein [Phycisphaerales bacterium]